jgi:ATP adenylyltransferase
MDRLWAPWRMPYILAEADKREVGGCIFCDLPAQGADRHRENLILACGQRALVILNRYPYTNGHLMVVPRAHVADPSLLAVEDYRVVTELLRRTTAALRQAVSPHGLNLGMNLGRVAGAGIDEHCHYHVVPRWSGDTNFIAVTGDTKVISEGLLETYDRIAPYVADLAAAVERDAGLTGQGAP